MADLNEFEDIEVQLRRHHPPGPSAEVRAAVLEEAARLSQVMPRRKLWRYAAAAVLLIALNLGTEHCVSARLRLGAPVRQESAVTANGLELLKSLNGNGAHFYALALISSGRAGRPASWLSERQALLKELE